MDSIIKNEKLKDLSRCNDIKYQLIKELALEQRGVNFAICAAKRTSEFIEGRHRRIGRTNAVLAGAQSMMNA